MNVKRNLTYGHLRPNSKNTYIHEIKMQVMKKQEKKEGRMEEKVEREVEKKKEKMTEQKKRETGAKGKDSV